MALFTGLRRRAKGPVADAALAPISGVTLEQYVHVARGIAAYRYDASKLPIVAEAYGIQAARWEIAAAGWAARIQSNAVVGAAFNRLYTQ